MKQQTTDFETFWQAYPRHVGKLAAVKAYQRARTVATAAEILAGIERYLATKPAYADYCHPATWLNQGRWMDEPDATPEPAPDADWFEECQRLHGGRCGGRVLHHSQMVIDQGKARAS